MIATHEPERQRRILLVDDDESIAGSLRAQLLTQGCLVDVAGESDLAETLMRASDYDVVLVDPYHTGGPGEDSGAFVDLTRQLQPRAYLIVLTEYASPPLARAATERGVAALLAKPQPVLVLSQFIATAAGAMPAVKERL